MTKRLTTVNVDEELLSIAKQRGINISALLRDTLRAELMGADKDREQIKLTIQTLALKKETVERNSKKEIINLQNEINHYEKTLTDLKGVEDLKDTSKFKELLERFKKVAEDNGYALSTLNLRTWRGLFKRDAEVNLSQEELISLMNGFKED